MRYYEEAKIFSATHRSVTCGEVWRRGEGSVSRHFAVYILPGLAAVGAAMVLRSLALGTLLTAMLTVAIILGGAAWVVIAARHFK
jgi:hypothetical protein